MFFYRWHYCVSSSDPVNLSKQEKKKRKRKTYGFLAVMWELEKRVTSFSFYFILYETSVMLIPSKRNPKKRFVFCKYSIFLTFYWKQFSHILHCTALNVFSTWTITYIRFASALFEHVSWRTISSWNSFHKHYSINWIHVNIQREFFHGNISKLSVLKWPQNYIWGTISSISGIPKTVIIACYAYVFFIIFV